MSRIITRAEWDALPAKGRGNVIAARPKGVTVHWVGGRSPLGLTDHARCFIQVRGIQRYHQSKGYVDIAYNYLPCPHGDVFEGRGLLIGSGANGTTAGNRDWYAVCALVGPGDPLTEALWDALALSVRTCRKLADDAVNGHRDHLTTECPGTGLYSALDRLRVREQEYSPVPTLDDSPWAADPRLGVDGDFGPASVKALQRVLRDRYHASGLDGPIEVDGDFGRNSKAALQRTLNHLISTRTTWAYRCPVDGDLSAADIRVLQWHTRTPADGDWGPATTKAIQTALNNGTF